MAARKGRHFKFIFIPYQGLVGVSSLPSAAMMMPAITAAAASTARITPEPPSRSSPEALAPVRAASELEDTGCCACARTGALTRDAAATAAIPILPKRIFSSFRVSHFNSYSRANDITICGNQPRYCKRKTFYTLVAKITHIARTPWSSHPLFRFKTLTKTAEFRVENVANNLLTTLHAREAKKSAGFTGRGGSASVSSGIATGDTGIGKTRSRVDRRRRAAESDRK